MSLLQNFSLITLLELKWPPWWHSLWSWLPDCRILASSRCSSSSGRPGGTRYGAGSFGSRDGKFALGRIGFVFQKKPIRFQNLYRFFKIPCPWPALGKRVCSRQHSAERCLLLQCEHAHVQRRHASARRSRAPACGVTRRPIQRWWAASAGVLCWLLRVVAR
jgi:hypothetical protein